MKIGVFHIALRMLVCVLILFPQYVLAGPPSVRIPGFNGGRVVTPPPPTTLPQLKPGGVAQGVTVVYPSQNECVVNQNLGQQNAIIDWSKFNISSDASVKFNQGTGTPGTDTWKPNSNYAALNRIWDASPSQIFGNLTADGKIYLINQNGILFGPGSRVNVNGLVASALNIKDSDFLNNVLHFTYENYQSPGSVLDPANTYVSNTGEITAAPGGYIFLIGPNVENYGTISAPTGQIGLVAAKDVQLILPSNDDARSGYYVIVNDPGDGVAVNGADKNLNVKGQLYADGGLVGMYGYNVEQDGIIRSITAYKNKQGQVELRAVNQVTTGEGSEIDLPIDDSIDSATGQIRTVNDTFVIQPIVVIGGLQWVSTSDSSGKHADLSGMDQLTSAYLTNNYDPLTSIELHGAIIAPTGQVTLNAAKSVSLMDTSSINVGGVVADLPPAVIIGKLTSTELSDAYQQKTGLLPGTTITTTPMAGSSIGNISQWLMTQERTAVERSIGSDAQKGTVTITVTADDGKISVGPQAGIDISGGAINYSSGFVNTTKLVSGNKIYDISNAPLNLHYDKVLGNYEKVYSRFGIIQTYTNYGLVPKTYVQGYTKGGDAGTLTLAAKTVDFQGTLKSGVTTGVYQNTRTMPGSYTSDVDYQTARALSVARGLEAPTAGTLQIGSDMNADQRPDSIAIVADTSSSLTGVTQLSATMLGNDRDPAKANLSKILLYANNDFSTEEGAKIYLQPGGTFSATAASIIHQGEINVPAGTINLTIQGGSTDPGSGAQQRIVLASGSKLDVSGQITDNRLNGMTLTVRTQGGDISLLDETAYGLGVFIQNGALVDVSGGYTIDSKGKVASAGNAGTLTIQGWNMQLEGDIRGYALADANGKVLGGSVTLASNEIKVVPHGRGDNWSGFDALAKDPNDPSSLTTKIPNNISSGVLNLSDDFFDDKGFSQITLNSVTNLTIGDANPGSPSVNIAPSIRRLNNPPVAAGTGGQAQTVYGTVIEKTGSMPSLIELARDYDYMAGPSSFTATAGYDFAGKSDQIGGHMTVPTHGNENITINKDATVNTAHAVSSVARISNDTNPTPVKTGIFLTGPNVDIAGTLESRGGSISATSTYYDLVVESTAQILAQGYNRPDPSSTPKGFPMNRIPVDAGSVSLTASNGSLIFNTANESNKYLIDISGSDPVPTTLATADGSYKTFTQSSNPGSLSLSFNNLLTGDNAVNFVNVSPAIPGAQAQGASLSIKKLAGELDIDWTELDHYVKAGFDDISLISHLSSLRFKDFSDDKTETINRKLTLDAQVINSDGSSVNLSAPWIIVQNSYQPYNGASTAVNGGTFTLSGQTIDVIGTTRFSGFDTVTLHASQDIRLSQAGYKRNDTTSTYGMSTLSTDGALVLDANRIYAGNYYIFDTSTTNWTATVYPDIYSDYTVQAGGLVTMNHSNVSDGTFSDNKNTPIYSAGSNLTVIGKGGIEVDDDITVAAPLGTITLSAPGQSINLNGGILTTAGDPKFSVLYNNVSDNNKWVSGDKADPNKGTTPFTAIPQHGVTLDAGATGKVTVGGNATIDVKDTGSLFSFKYQPSLAGTSNPLSKSGRYVVFPVADFPMPGKSVYLQGGGGLSAGWYTLLPLDSNTTQNQRYAFMPGAYILDVQSGLVLPGARSVTKEGYVLTYGFTGVAGTPMQSSHPQIYSVRKATDVLAEGDFTPQGPMQADHAGDITITGGTVILNTKNVITGNGGGKISLNAPNITVQQTASSSSDPGNLYVTEDFLSNKNFSEIDLGNDNTFQVVIADGVVLNAGGALVLTAKSNNASSITVGAANLGENSSGQSVTDEITLATTGTLYIDPSSVIHARKNITLDINDLANVNVGTDNIFKIATDPADVLKVDNSSITLKSANIYLGNKNGLGLYLTKTMLDKFSGYRNLTLASLKDIQFTDPTLNSLSAADRLTLDAARIANFTNHSVTVEAPTVNIKNSSGNSGSNSDMQANVGIFTVNATDPNAVNQINIGHGDVLFGGFTAINLNSNGDVAFKGAGSLATGGADLNIAARRITTAADAKNSDGTYEAPNFNVVAGSSNNDLNPDGIITMTSTGRADTTTVPGGTLEFAARKIDVATVIQSDGGDIKLTTSGVPDPSNPGKFLPSTDSNGNSLDGIIIEGTGQILVPGTDNTPGGHVTLETDFITDPHDGSGTGAVVNGQSGKIELKSGSLIDVSAGSTLQGDGITYVSQGYAGVVTLSAPGQGVIINGHLKGTAGTKTDNSLGSGGSLVLDTQSIADFSWLPVKTNNGVISGLEGFTASLDLRARTGNITIASTDTVAAQHIKLTADGTDGKGNIVPGGGNVYVYGTLDASNYGNFHSISSANGIDKFTITKDTNDIIGFTYNGKDYKTTIPVDLGTNNKTYSGQAFADAVAAALNNATASDGTSVGAIFKVAYEASGQLIVTNQSAISVTNFMSTSVDTLSPLRLGFVSGSSTITIPGFSPDGGKIELYANNNVNVEVTGTIKAMAYGAQPNQGPALNAMGGSVFLSSENGQVNVNNGSSINVSAGTNGTGGTVYLRAQRNNSDVNINLSSGSITGASAVYAEAFKQYTAYNNLQQINTWLSEASAYYNGNLAVTRLEGAAPAGAATFHLLPGIEVDWSGPGDFTVGTLVDLSPTITNTRYQTPHDTSLGKIAEPGVLIIRASNNLNITQNLVDHPTSLVNLNSSSAQSSWGFNLVAGADLTSADFMAVNRGTGDLNLLTNPANPAGTGTLVYTENAPLRFASGRDTVVGNGVAPGYMIVTKMPAVYTSYPLLNIASAGNITFTYNGEIYTANISPKIYTGLSNADGTALASDIANALNTATANANSVTTMIPGNPFSVSFNLTATGQQLVVKNNSGNDVTGFDASLLRVQNPTGIVIKAASSTALALPILTLGAANNKIGFTYNNVSKTATISAGSYYDVYDVSGVPGLITTVQAALNTAIGVPQGTPPVVIVTSFATSEGQQLAFWNTSSTELTMNKTNSVFYWNSATDTIASSSMAYNIASYRGPIQGHVGRDLILNGGAIQTATGIIDIVVGRDLQLNQPTSSPLGAIRTTGELGGGSFTGLPYGSTPYADVSQTVANNYPVNQADYYWEYANGGDITLDVGGNVGKYDSTNKVWQTAADPNAWDYYTPVLKFGGAVASATTANDYFSWFSASYAVQKSTTIKDDNLNYTSINYGTTAGLATMGGGNMTVRSGGDFQAQAGTFGGAYCGGAFCGKSAGDLIIYSGGDVKGRFLNAHGNADIDALGNLGSNVTGDKIQIELFDSRAVVTAAGEMQIAAVVNPSLASDRVLHKTTFVDCSYTQDTSIKLKAGGDVAIWGDTSAEYTTSTNLIYAKILPASVDIEAGGNINLESDHLTLASSPTGNLRLVAGGDITEARLGLGDNSTVSNGITMSDLFTSLWYGHFEGTNASGWADSRTKNNYHGDIFGGSSGAVQTLHTGDTLPVVVSAGEDIVNLGLYVPKMTQISTGRDIVNMMYEGQNVSPDDITSIKAGRDIRMNYALSNPAETMGFIQGGPGVFLVQAGDSIDLGVANDTSLNGAKIYGGIQTIGNANNPLLAGKSTLAVLAGYSQNFSADTIRTFFDELRDTGDLYSNLVAGSAKQEDFTSLIDRMANRDITIPNNITESEKKLWTALSDAAKGEADFIDNLRASAKKDGVSLYAKITSGSDAQDAAALLSNTRAQLIKAFLGDTSTIKSGTSAASAVLPGNTPITITSANNVIGFTYGGTDYKATLAPGSYMPDQLAGVISTALNSAGASAGAAFNVTATKAADTTTLTVSNRSTGDVKNFFGTSYTTLQASQCGFNGAGNIDMTSSQIGASVGKSDIFVLSNGVMSLGKTALPTSSAVSASTTGIWTGGGGGVNVFAKQDINVNESRIMTYYGGDITVWSDEGSINAGRGSRTAVSASPPKKHTTNGVTTWVFIPPAAGSGIRAVTYGDNAPDPGNIHLFAPSGVIDAGEAGIAGGKIILGALHVNNASNISFSAGSIGVPQAKEASVNIGAMTGAGLAQGSQLSGDASGIAAARAQTSQMIDDIMAKWLDVKFVDFVIDE